MSRAGAGVCSRSSSVNPDRAPKRHRHSVQTCLPGDTQLVNARGLNHELHFTGRPGAPLTDPHDLRARIQHVLSNTYVLERELGGGGMSRLFLAEERALGRRVVVKVLSPELAHELSTERFAREIQLSAQLQHPNIVPVLTAGAALGLPYYTMPFIDGESLRARLARLPRGERLPMPQAIEVLRDIARALAYAHSLGVVHRDIKPENVLLAYDAAVVADFGVAKAMAAARTQDASERGTTLTQTGVALGTPAYMAPEQASGDPSVNHRADIYAWGILAWELLGGQHPFADRLSVHALVTAHLATTPPPLSVAAPGVPPALSGLVMRCLAKDPTARPATARELLDALAAVKSEERPASAPVESAGRSGLATRTRSRAAAIAMASVLLAALAGGAAWVMRDDGSVAVTATPRVPDAPAYDLYLRGKVRVSSENREDNDAAIAALRDAIAADQSLAAAHAELARAYTIKAFYYAPDSEKKRLNEDAEVAVAKALSLDPKLGAAHFARGLMLWTPGRRFPHEQAVQAYRQAIALDSTLDEAHHQLALVLLHVGLLDEAQVEVEKSLAINPGNTLARFRIGVIEMYRGEYERAHAVFNSTPLDRNPSLWAFQMATALFRLGREREATDLIDRFLRDYPNDEGGVGHSVRAVVLARQGKRGEAEAAIALARELGRGFGHFHHSAYNIGSAYALLGDSEMAVQALQDAAEDGFPCYPLFATDMLLDGLRRNPRFVALMNQLERDWTERKKSF